MMNDFESIDYENEKETFFHYATEEYGLVWDEIENKNTEQLERLNEMLRSLSAGGMFSIYEMVLFMFEDIFDDPRKLISYLDKGNNESMREDIREKYPDTRVQSTLDLFMK